MRELDAMIFAAGLGTRLRPLTDSCPKALIEVGGRTMLERAIGMATAAGARRMAVNIHHHPPMMRRWLAGHAPEVAISDESAQLLDTGAGLAKALPLLGAEDTLVINADILTDLDARAMTEVHRSSGADVTLLAARRNTSRYLLFDSEGRMRGWTNTSTGETRPAGLQAGGALARLAFGGIHVVGRRAAARLAAYCAGRGPFSITDFYIDCCGELDIRAYLPPGPFTWIDIGRPDTLAEARRREKI